MAKGTRTLYVVRHAKSSWEQPVPDHERSLAPRGRRALELVAGYVDEHAVRPDLVLCSTARRAVATLEPLLPVLGDPEVSTEDNLYGASGSEVVARLHQVNERTSSVMVIGHNPGLQDLVLSLASSGSELDSVREKYPTGALATLEFDRPWGELGPGCARVTAFVRPRDLQGV